MLQYTKPLGGAAHSPVYTNDYDNGLEQWYTLKLSPGNNNATYQLENPSNPAAVKFGVSPEAKTTNYLTFGVTNANVTASIFSDLVNITTPPDTEWADTFTYTYTYKFGEFPNLLVALGCPASNIFNHSYNVSKVSGSSMAISPVYGIQVSGSVLTTLGFHDYKLWRLSLTPQQVFSIVDDGDAILHLGFTTSTNTHVPFHNISIVDYGLDGSGKKENIIKDSKAMPNLDVSSASVVKIKFVVVPHTYSWCWQTLLPDTTCTTITLGAASSSSSSKAVGPVAVNASVIANLKLRNTLEWTDYTITSILTTVMTPSIASLTNVSTAFVKNKVAGDFSVTFKDASGGNVTTIPLCTSTNLTQTSTTSFVLNHLDAVDVIVTYAPKVKIVPTAAMLTPYNVSTATIIANSINNNRKIKIQVMGYLNGGSTTPVPLGDPIIVSGSVI